MRSIRAYKSLFIFSSLLSLSHNSWASSDAKLIISPQICVVAQQDKQCSTVIDIHYQSPVTGDFCAVIPAFDMRRCYHQVNEFKLSVDVKTEQAIIIEIQAQHSQQILKRTKMDVVLYKKKKTRKRRNFGWNFL